MGLKINDHGKIIFRHPHVFKGKYGKVICVAVAKLSGERQGKVKDCLETLLASKPLIPDDFKGKPDQIALDAYFNAMKPEKPKYADATKLKAKDIPDADHSIMPDQFRSDMKHGALIDAQQEIRRLKAQLEGVVKSTGIRSEAENSVTVGAAYAHYEKHVRCRSEEARSDVLRIVKAVINRLGEKTLYCELTKSVIETACNEAPSEKKGLNPKPSKSAIFNRLREMKRFCKEISWPVESDGMGLRNPAVAIKAGSQVTLQKGRRKDGKVQTLDPKELLKNGKLSHYWKAMIAVLGYGGLRLSEAAALTWNSLCVKDGLIQIRPSAIKPELKSYMSERDVKPFTNVWKFLKIFRKVAKHDAIIFDREGHPSGPTWFEDRKGKPRAINLPGALIDAISDAVFPAPKEGEKKPKVKEPARRLRRFWETSMREKGLGHLIEMTGGHSSEVGLAHYTKFESVIKAATVGSL